MKVKPVSAVVLSLILASCAHTAGNKSPPSAIRKADVYYDTQAIIGECPSRHESAIFTAVAASMVAKGVSKIGEAIKAAANADAKVAFARRNIEISTAKGIMPCVVIVRGWFYRSPPIYAASNPPRAASPFHVNAMSKFPHNSQAQAAQFWRNGLHIAATPDFYFKGSVRTSVDKSAYTVAPMEATLDLPISSTILRSGKRYVLIALAISPAGTVADLQNSPGTTLTLGRLEPGELLSFPEGPNAACFSYITTGENPELKHGRCPAADSYVSLMRSPLESTWFNVTGTEKPKPMLLQALVSEMRSGSKFLEFVGEVFAATSNTLTEELQQALVPTLGLTAEEAKKQVFDAVLAKAVSELGTCISHPADASKRILARIAVRDLVSAARSAGQTGFERISPDVISNGGTDAAACQSVLDQLK